MMTEREGNEHLDLLLTISKAYVESELTWGELNKIPEFMLRGESFGTVVQKLNLDRQISADLRLMMEAIDKQAIVEFDR